MAQCSVRPTSESSPRPSRSTGKERDSESGNDYFGARYYASSMGRFSSPDPSQLFFADPTNPQSLNLYSYALNNPLRFTDPTGLYCDYSDHVDPSSGFDSSQFDYHSNSGECGQNGGQWVNDAYTHFGYDDLNRPEQAVSSLTTGNNNNPYGDMLDSLAAFAGNGPKSLSYGPDDAYSIDFEMSRGMAAINKQIQSNCNAGSGKGGVGTVRAALNTAADANGGFPSISEAQLGAFSYSYTQNGGTVDVTVNNDITMNSLAYHMMSSDPDLAADNTAGSPLDSLGRLSGNVPFGRVNQTIHLIAVNPCK